MSTSLPPSFSTLAKYTLTTLPLLPTAPEPVQQQQEEEIDDGEAKAVYDGFVSRSRNPCATVVNAALFWFDAQLTNQLVDYAFVGDCAMYMRGFPVLPQDIEIVRSRVCADTLRDSLESHAGLIVPDYQPCPTVLHAFIRPGKTSGNENAADLPKSVMVHVLIAIEGNIQRDGAGPSDVVELVRPANRQGISADRQTRRLPTIGIPYTFSGLLTRYIRHRESDAHSLGHIVWLLSRHRAAIVGHFNMRQLTQVRDDLRQRQSTEMADIVERLIRIQRAAEAHRQRSRRHGGTQIHGHVMGSFAQDGLPTLESEAVPPPPHQ